MNRARAFLALIGCFVLHVTVFAHIRPFGVAPEVLLLATILGGLVAGPETGARFGFLAGLLFDLMAAGPFGLAAGVFAATGHMVGIFSRTFDSQDLRVGPAAVLLGSFLGVIVYGLGLGILGQEQYVEWGLLRTAAFVTAWNLLLGYPLNRVFMWATQASESGFARPDRVRSVVN